MISSFFLDLKNKYLIKKILTKNIFFYRNETKIIKEKIYIICNRDFVFFIIILFMQVRDFK